MFTYRNNFNHFFLIDRSIAVDVVHSKGPLEFLLGFSCWRNVDGEEEFLEVDASAVVGVERAEDVLAELVGVAFRKETRIDVEEFAARQLTIGTITLERERETWEDLMTSHEASSLICHGYMTVQVSRWLLGEPITKPPSSAEEEPRSKQNNRFHLSIYVRGIPLFPREAEVGRVAPERGRYGAQCVL